MIFTTAFSMILFRCLEKTIEFQSKEKTLWGILNFSLLVSG